MARSHVAALAAAILLSAIGPARADQKEADAILDRAIKALGGQEKLDKADTIAWKFTRTARFLGDVNETHEEITLQGLNRSRKVGADGANHQAIIVVNGDKGWIKYNPGGTSVIEQDVLKGHKRFDYLQAVATRLVPLRGKGFKYESGGEEKVGSKDAVALKCTGPDGKPFTLLLDRKSGLPLAIRTPFTGSESLGFVHELTYSDYKDFDGLKVATKIDYKLGSLGTMTATITEFKILDKVDPETFAEPK